MVALDFPFHAAASDADLKRHPKAVATSKRRAGL